MKKLLIGVLAVACCIAFSVPAFAEIKVGGMISAEQFYWNVSKERLVAGGFPDGANNVANRSSYNSTEFAMGQPWNRLNVQYISDDKKVGGFLEIRTGGQRHGGNSISTGAALGNNAQIAGGANPTGEQNFDWELAYIDYHFNPNFYLRVGRQTQTFAIYSPDQQMGHNQGHIVLSGFGNIHGGTSRDAVRAYVKFNDMIRMELQALNPDSNGAAAAPGTFGELGVARTSLAGTAGALPALPASTQLNGQADVVRESNKIPRFDFSLPIKFGNFNVEPSASWSHSQYRGVATGSDDRYESWGAGVGAKWGMGPFTLSGEYIYGNNLGGASYVGAGNGAPMTFLRGATAVGITNSKTHSGWMQAEFNFGPFGIQAIGGLENAKNDGNPALAKAVDAAEFDVTRWAAGLQFPIYASKNLKVVPQVWYYNYGDSASLGSRAVDSNLGTEWTAGVFWQLTF